MIGYAMQSFAIQAMQRRYRLILSQREVFSHAAWSTYVIELELDSHMPLLAQLISPMASCVLV